MRYPDNMRVLLFCICLLCFGYEVLAQIDDADNFTTINTPITVDLDAEDEEDIVEAKEKKRKKKVFYGVKTRKAYTRSGVGDKLTLELFYVLKEWRDPDPYVRDIYWYDMRRRAIRVGGKIDKKYGLILHGPYQKKRGDQVIEEGIFYFGTKHGRWITLDKNDILLDKEKYYKGWPKESMVSYYDKERKKIKEIIPVEYGEKEGNYYYFFENGLIAVQGEYHFGQKVGKWTEFHYNTQRRKKIIQYPEDPFDTTTTPYTWREYDRRGRVVFQNEGS